MNYIKVEFQTPTDNIKDIITALLQDSPMQGIEYTDETTLVYFLASDWHVDILTEIEQLLKIPYQTEVVLHQNWNASWESNFEPIVVDNQVGLRAYFHPAFKDLPYDIEITPKMSFGTGHHETTQMMISMMLSIPFHNKRVLDFGCGTGVLAILAEKLKATSVIAIDNEPWSVENAIDNAKRNQCSCIDVRIDDIATIQPPFNIILANINLNILLQYMPILSGLLTSNGILLMSGILKDDLAVLSDAALQHHFSIIDTRIYHTWAAIHVTKS